MLERLSLNIALTESNFLVTNLQFKLNKIEDYKNLYQDLFKN